MAVVGLLVSGVGMATAFDIIKLSIVASKAWALVGFIISALGLGCSIGSLFA